MDGFVTTNDTELKPWKHAHKLQQRITKKKLRRHQTIATKKYCPFLKIKTKIKKTRGLNGECTLKKRYAL